MMSLMMRSLILGCMAVLISVVWLLVVVLAALS